MKRPSFQFYPADWKNNSKLRRCSDAARGAWVDVLCLLHDCDEYGVCRWPLAELARAAGIHIKLAKELVDKQVLKGADKAGQNYAYAPRHAGKEGAPVTLVTAGEGPCWYCSRFVRDEYVRQKRGNGSRFTTENQPTNGAGNGEPMTTPKTPFGVRQGDGPTSTSTSTSKPKAPKPPDGGLVPAAGKTVAIGLKAFLDQCEERKERPLRDYTPLWAYAESAGLDLEFIALAWAEFRRRFLPGGTSEAKKYKNWRQAFQKYVEGNYFRLWAIGPDDKYFLTTLGKQVQKVNETKDAA